MTAHKVRLKRSTLKEKKCHLVVVGQTGKGKSYYSAESLFFAAPAGWAKYSKASALKQVDIFFDTRNCFITPEYYAMAMAYSQVFKNDVAIVYTPEEFTKVFEGGVHHIIVGRRMSETSESFRNKVYDIVNTVTAYQDSVPMSVKEDVYFYFDEISSLTPKMVETPVSECFTQGRINKIHAIAISQRPQMVARYIYDEAPYLIMFQLKGEHYTALKKSYGLNVPIEHQVWLAKTQFGYMVYDGTAWTKSVKDK